MFATLMAANGGSFLRAGMSLVLPNKVENPFVSNEIAARFGMATEGQGATQWGAMNWTAEQAQANRNAAYAVSQGQFKTIEEALAYAGVGSTSTATTKAQRDIFKKPGMKTVDEFGAAPGIPAAISTTMPTKPLQVGGKNFTYADWAKYQTAQKATQDAAKARQAQNFVENLAPANKREDTPKGKWDKGERDIGTPIPQRNASPSWMEVQSKLPLWQQGMTSGLAGSSNFFAPWSPEQLTSMAEAYANPEPTSTGKSKQPLNNPTSLVNQELTAGKIPQSIPANIVDGLSRLWEDDARKYLVSVGYSYDASSHSFVYGGADKVSNLPPLVTDGGTTTGLPEAPSDWWGGMFGLTDPKYQYYLPNEPSYTGRSPNVDLNSLTAGYINFRVETG
jgi:hypothetical protein